MWRLFCNGVHHGLLARRSDAGLAWMCSLVRALNGDPAASHWHAVFCTLKITIRIISLINIARRLFDGAQHSISALLLRSLTTHSPTMLVLYTLDMEGDLHRQIKSAVLLRDTGFAGYNTLAKVGVEQADALVHYV